MKAFLKLNCLALTFALSFSCFAGPIVFLNETAVANKVRLETFLTTQLDVKSYREIRVQAFQNPDYYVLYLFSDVYHTVELAKLTFTQNGVGELLANYQFTPNELDTLSRHKTRNVYACPDVSTQFIVFAPIDKPIEQHAANEVASAAMASGLKTVVLSKDAATHNAFLNYLKCPNLKGSFYDGDANKQIIMTADGAISYIEVQRELASQFQYQSTHVWVACEAFLDPFKSTLIVNAAAKKYAAGINKLIVGPSDKMAVCTLKAAFAGQSVTAAFQECYAKWDDKRDQWGLEGAGSDYF